MAGYNYNPYSGNNVMAQMNGANFSMPQPQQLFSQPQGNVYTINNTLEVANIPAGAGLSVALCLNEGLAYIKSMQNGQPMFWAYKLIPYVEEENGEKEKVADCLWKETHKYYVEWFENLENCIKKW